jgi:flavin-dependent thymidylate synthase
VIRDMSEITDDERKHYYDECFKTTLKAPLEAIDFHFMVEGVTRAHTHQEVRQRTAVFAQESMRFAVKERIAARPGPLISQDPEALKVWTKGVEFIHGLYLTLIGMGIPAEEARGLLPHDTLTRLHHKVNLRNLMDELGKRTCTQAQFDWKMWAAQVRASIHHYKGPALDNGPDPSIFVGNAWQFQYIAQSPIFHPICFNTGHCMFKAQMDRGCTIRERVERGAFDEIRPEEWAADPRAAWVR